MFNSEQEKKEAVQNLVAELTATDEGNYLHGIKQRNFLQQLYDFSYLSQPKFLDFYTGMIETNISLLLSRATTLDCKDLPMAKNWMTEGKMSAVQNQFPCGSSFLFAAVSAVESAMAIQYDTFPVKLSNQHLLECVKNMTGGEYTGCNGGRFVLFDSSLIRNLSR